ncbi:MAG: hypothetical protein GEU71_02335 [Actinobacteria bacterium]|nr:hypothetical protein [Actinomycetota bacterium]
MRTETPRSTDGGAAAPPSSVPPPNRRLKVAGVALLVVGAIVAGLAFAGVFDSDAGDAPGSTGPDMKTHSNRAGGYSFSYPSEWKVRKDGSTSIVTAPGSTQIVSFGTAPDGPLRRSARRFLSQVVRAYQDPALSAAELQRIDDRRALAVAGEAVNESGVAIRFLTVTVAGGRDGNYGIAAYTDAAANPTETLPVMQAILDSFRIRS